jgi:hypothetical protein
LKITFPPSGDYFDIRNEANRSPSSELGFEKITATEERSKGRATGEQKASIFIGMM